MRKGVAAVSPFTAPVLSADEISSSRRPFVALQDLAPRSLEVQEYPELGMETIWRIEVEDFPAFILVDDKGKG